MLFRNTMRELAPERDGWKDLRRLFTSSEESLSGKQSLKETTVYTCIRILAETVGKLPLKIYRDENGRRKAADHP